MHIVRTTTMWNYVNFSTEKQMQRWIETNGDKYVWVEIFVYVGFQIKYRRKMKWERNK